MLSVRMFLAVFAGIVLAGLAQAQTQITVYSNVTSFTGSAMVNGGTTSTSTSTKLVADDITFASGSAGLPVTGFQFSVANLNSVQVTASPQIRFYADNSGSPGTLLGGLNFNSLSYNANQVGVVSYNPGTTLFTIPSSGTIWAGITFVASGSTTSAQLNELGQGTFNPPTVGSSNDTYFLSSSTDVTSGNAFAASNPAGSELNLGGSPVANFGWSFTATVPEPGLCLFAGALAASAFGLRRRTSSYLQP